MLEVAVRDSSKVYIHRPWALARLPICNIAGEGTGVWAMYTFTVVTHTCMGNAPPCTLVGLAPQVGDGTNQGGKAQEAEQHDDESTNRLCSSRRRNVTIANPADSAVVRGAPQWFLRQQQVIGQPVVRSSTQRGTCCSLILQRPSWHRLGRQMVRVGGSVTPTNRRLFSSGASRAMTSAEPLQGDPKNHTGNPLCMRRQTLAGGWALAACKQ